jgi:hypothetical protein
MINLCRIKPEYCETENEMTMLYALEEYSDTQCQIRPIDQDGKTKYPAKTILTDMLSLDVEG